MSKIISGPNMKRRVLPRSTCSSEACAQGARKQALQMTLIIRIRRRCVYITFFCIRPVLQLHPLLSRTGVSFQKQNKKDFSTTPLVPKTDICPSSTPNSIFPTPAPPFQVGMPQVLCLQMIRVSNNRRRPRYVQVALSYTPGCNRQYCMS